MGCITFVHHGDFKDTEQFLKKATNGSMLKALDEYGLRGVQALEAATPIESGKTASSWSYEIHRSRGEISITWTNSNIVEGVNIAVILQYGHGTRNGGFVMGRDYINPAIQPIFDEIADSAWKEVTSK